MIWTPNDFPYKFEAGVEHHCVWCESSTVTRAEIDTVIEQNRTSKGYEAVRMPNLHFNFCSLSISLLPRNIDSRNPHHHHPLSVCVCPCRLSLDFCRSSVSQGFICK